MTEHRYAPALLVALGCADGARHGDDADSAPPAASANLAVAYTADDHVGNVLHATWQTPGPCVGRLLWLDPTESWHSTGWEAEATTEHAVHVLGLPPGEDLTVVPEVSCGEDRIVAGEETVIAVPELPLELPYFSVRVDDGTTSADLLTTVMGVENSAVVVLNERASAIWYLLSQADQRIMTARPDLEGTGIWYAAQPTTYDGPESIVVHVSFDGTTYDRWEPYNSHSDVAPLPEGGFGYIAKLEQPWDDGVLLYDAIWEQDAEGDLYEIFSPLDWFEPERLCDCFDLPLLEEMPGDTTWYDWTHANSLVLSEDGSAWYMMVRYFDAVIKVDRATGNLEWVLGGPYSDFAMDEYAQFSHGHMSQFGDQGFVVFDNGTHNDPPVSRVAEYRLDQDAREVELVWQHFATGNAFVDALGDAVREPDGSMLVSWSSLGLAEHIDADRELIWSGGTELGYYLGRVKLIDALE